MGHTRIVAQNHMAGCHQIAEGDGGLFFRMPWGHNGPAQIISVGFRLTYAGIPRCRCMAENLLQSWDLDILVQFLRGQQCKDAGIWIWLSRQRRQVRTYPVLIHKRPPESLLFQCHCTTICTKRKSPAVSLSKAFLMVLHSAIGV